MPTERPRIYITCDKPDVEALDALVTRVHGMPRGNVALACLRAGLAVLTADPTRATSYGPGGAAPEEPKARKTK
jgi:hypothetical protein